MFNSLSAAILSPVTDTVELVADAAQGKLNTKAATRLAADVAVGYAVSELIDAVLESDDDE